MYDPLDILQKIQRSEAPPFLFTRIEAKLQEAQDIKLTPKFVVAICSVLLLVLTVNYTVVNNSHSEQYTPSLSYLNTSLSPEQSAYYNE